MFDILPPSIHSFATLSLSLSFSLCFYLRRPWKETTASPFGLEVGSRATHEAHSIIPSSTHTRINGENQHPALGLLLLGHRQQIRRQPHPHLLRRLARHRYRGKQKHCRRGPREPRRHPLPPPPPLCRPANIRESARKLLLFTAPPMEPTSAAMKPPPFEKRTRRRTRIL
ncbi:hypothetical protein KSP40_PGU004095 [Platanthera guangdongensis]|uniref:Uncharacterized protein n=1 Tax=Platanthera guangdongensis TaxID=2320717 RepID=A0ABR2LHE6_9ASPA